MKIFLFIKQAILSILSNKLRSFLSTLGIIIGITSFIVMLSFGEGTQKQILDSFGESGSMIQVIKNGIETSGKNIFTSEIIKEISEKVPNASKVYGEYSLPIGKIQYKDQPIYGGLKVFTKGAFQHIGLLPQYGTLFTEQNYKNKDKVVIVGNSLVADIFGEENPLGKYINIGGELFLVIGVLQKKDWEYDNYIYIPESTGKYIFNISNIANIFVYSKFSERVEQLKKDLDYFLYKKSQVTTQENLGYNLHSDKEFLKNMQESTKSFTYLLAGIGAISLIVGGIGIMNIMIVSVTERTREIGIRKAIGATNGNILFQFLIESIVLTLVGSIFALGLSYGIVYIINNMNLLGFPVVINLKVVNIALIVATSMGIIFGIMPAYKAAKLKPIDALHFE